ncbi:hypothetical protein KC717_02945 [Candidatus Dojkabacteria bacterium]|uniref:Uncharacterized protein n=1 Tax=Candidatus Dojkabacteria bacterium TaxID=2099670 RepID=A0A955L7S8_9BACT|nr:hypothetical protein [Candidatus Dojkabacteria bacterium]
MVFQIWTNFLVFFLAVTLLPGIEVNKGLEGYLVAGLIYVAFVLLLPRIIEFFKVNVNFWSFLMFGSVLSIGYFYLMKYIFVSYLLIGTFSSNEALLGIQFLRGISLNEAQVITFAGIFTMVLVSIHEWLLGR